MRALAACLECEFLQAFGISLIMKLLIHYKNSVSSTSIRKDLIRCFLWFLRWSAEFGASKYGSPELHAMLAEYIYSESPEVVSVIVRVWCQVYFCSFLSSGPVKFSF